MHDESAETRIPTSRRARIVLWSVLAAGLLAVLGTPVAIFAALSYSASQKAANIAALEELGAYVSEDSPDEKLPEWLVRLLGEENFSEVDSVRVGQVEKRLNRAKTEEFLQRVGQFPHVHTLVVCSEQVRGSELRELSFFGQLKHLVVHCPEFTDDDAQVLGELQQLESIKIGSNRLTDAGMAALAELRDMEMVDIRAPHVTDLGFAALPLGPKLWGLQLTGTSVGDATLQRLAAGAPGLHVVDLSQTKVTNAGLVHLQSLYQLSDVALSGTAVTDSGLAAIAQIKGLQSLDLSNTQVTDEGVALLASLPHLESLVLSNTQVTDRAIDALKDAPVVSLHLNDTRVTDATLEVLAGWPRMDGLELRGTQVTAKGLARFAEANMPGSMSSDIDVELWYRRNKADK